MEQLEFRLGWERRQSGGGVGGPSSNHPPPLVVEVLGRGCPDPPTLQGVGAALPFPSFQCPEKDTHPRSQAPFPQ